MGGTHPPPVSIPPNHLPPEARRLADRFEFLAELGRGGMAVVYLARLRADGRPVAVKLIAGHQVHDPDAVRRFEREARTVAMLRHPNLVRTLGVEALDGRAVAIVNEYVRGRTLRSVLREVGAFRFEAAAAVLRDVAAGLAHAHAARVVHRDVKPENVFLEDGTGRALLADFGVARPLDAETQLTIAGGSLGTPTYMAPEQVDGGPADPRADVYALGLVGWEMVSGRRPWQGETLYAVLHKQKHERLPDLAALRPDVPAFLLAAIAGATEKDPARRWRDAGEFLERLTPRPLVLDAPPANPGADAVTLRRLVPRTDDALPPPPPPFAPPEGAPPAPTPVDRPADVVADVVPEVATPVLTRAVEPEPEPSWRPDAPDAPDASDAPGGAAPRPRSRGRRVLAGVVGVLALLVVALLAVERMRAPTPIIPATPPAAAAPPPLVLPPVATSAGDVRLDTTPAPPAPTPDSTPAAPTSPTAPARPAANRPALTGAPLAERCRSTNNTDQRACLLGQLRTVDGAMTRAYQQLIGDYRQAAGGEREPLTVRRLRSEQRLWLAERDRVCRLRTRATEGALWGAARIPCFRELATRRTTELAGRRGAAQSSAAPRRRVGTGEP